MSRDTALVSRRLGREEPRRPRHRLRRGRRGHHRLRRRPHPRRRQARLEDRPAGPGAPGLRQQGSSSRRCSRSGASATTTPSSCTAATTTGSPRTRTGTSSSTATATSSCSTAAARSGSWTTVRSSTDAGVPPGAPRTSAQEQDLSIRAFRDEVVAAIGAKNLVDVRSPDEYAGRLLAPAHLPQEQAQRAGHIPTALSRAVVQGGQRGRHVQVRRRPAHALRRGGPRRRQGHHRVLPHRRALLAHLVRAAGAARATRT